MNDTTLDRQARRLNRLTRDLLRQIQMRDRNETTCCGVSVSQCYALDLLAVDGPLSMQSLARKMFLEKSTMTRIVDGLIGGGLAERRPGSADRRTIEVRLSQAGRKAWENIRDRQLESLRAILKRLPPARRGGLIRSMELFSSAVQDWLETCCPTSKIQIKKGVKP